MKFLNVVKIAWMFFWRMAIVKTIWFPQFGFWSLVFTAVIIAAVLVYALNTNLRTFPIIRLLAKRGVVEKFEKTSTNVSHPVAPAPATRTVGTYDNLEVISKPTARGMETGFEPRVLDQIEVPKTPYMRGVPGVGLDSAAHMTNYSVRSGKKGEVNFSKALANTLIANHNGKKNSILENVNSFWSVAMPSADNPSVPDAKYKTDIDSIIISGNHIVLVDTKFYASGDVTYTSADGKLYCIDNPTGKLVNKPRSMSRNMAMALERFTKHYPDMQVHALVVFMPTDYGTARLNAEWTGGIPVVNIRQAIGSILPLASTSGVNVSNPNILTNLSMLRKR